MLGISLLSLLCVLLATVSVGGESLELKGNKDIEFYDELEKGASWGVQFQIVDGAIGFRLTSPDGVIFEGPAETYGSYALTAKVSGIHSFKFINSDPIGSPAKRFSFNILGDTTEPSTGFCLCMTRLV